MSTDSPVAGSRWAPGPITATYLHGAVTVTRRSDDWHACITDHSAVWGCGPSIEAAIGDLVASHPTEIVKAVL